jgi:diaminohydroxyphosphoribosylaminopyrimidine deaminase/5-amino-6-(5-phosphoribosylamino)uracil reductase
MQLAVELGYRGRGFTKTNPCVGAVVVKNGQVIGQGWHEVYGQAHAEVNALHDAESNQAGSTQDADIYVTLEPCTTHGKTPPCCNAIIGAGIKRVFIGVLDPNPVHAGKAIAVLRAAGIEVQWGIHAQACAELIEDFAKLQFTNMPYVTLKLAQSLDGKIATYTGQSQWITSTDSRRTVHKMRSESDAVVVGIGTALADDPELTVRMVPTNQHPTRVIFDSSCRIPMESKLVQGAMSVPLVVVSSARADGAKVQALGEHGVQVIIAGESQVDIPLALRELGEMNMMNLLLEGGSTLAGAFLAAGCVDQVRVFVAPTLIGGDSARGSLGGQGVEQLKDAITLHTFECIRSGVDFLFQGKITDYSSHVLELTAAAQTV